MCRGRKEIQMFEKLKSPVNLNAVNMRESLLESKDS